jgi:hypothetical protein
MCSRGVIGMSFGMNVMPVCEMGVVSSFRVTAGIEIVCRFSVMTRGLFVVLSGFVMVFGGLSRHDLMIRDQTLTIVIR